MNSRKHKQKENQRKKQEKQKLIDRVKNFQKVEEELSKT